MRDGQPHSQRKTTSGPITAVLVGAGNRGYGAYGPYALSHPDEIRFVAVAEPHETRRARFAGDHSIPSARQFHTWQDLFAQGRIADAALVCTLDRMHVGPALAALDAGYDVLLEKPIATTLDDCVELVQAAERAGRLLLICHVLRYTPLFATVHEIIASGRLGEIVTVEHRENVTYWHMAHSYVRGNWRSSAIESPMLLAKCCHDLDILFWNLGPCKRLNSFGSLKHFRPGNAPSGAPQRCTDGCPAADECPWYAPRLYLDLVPLIHVARYLPDTVLKLGATLALEHPALLRAARKLFPRLDVALDYSGWPVSVISEDTSLEARWRALETGPYGRCVYRCDNDVVDHQVVNMEMASGASAVLVMHGHSHREGRTMRYDGTRATLRARTYLGQQEIQIHDHLTGKVEIIRVSEGTAGATGHGGGDWGLMAAFVRALRGQTQAITTARESLESHLLAFAAEQARLENQVIEMDAFRRRDGGISEP
ncbi:MAG: Gfo/Idh/MocA family oxidoreductase [Anaerolineae bacterium]|nr:Gfo/Idh/MocA family oxidoreductase [Anaerolineae bacterium]